MTEQLRYLDKISVLNTEQIRYIRDSMQLNIAYTKSKTGEELSACGAYQLINCHLNTVMFSQNLDLNFGPFLYAVTKFIDLRFILNIYEKTGNRFQCDSLNAFLYIINEYFFNERYLYILFPSYPEHSLIIIRDSRHGTFYFDKQGFTLPFRLYNNTNELKEHYQSGVFWVANHKHFESEVSRIINSLNRGISS